MHKNTESNRQKSPSNIITLALTDQKSSHLALQIAYFFWIDFQILAIEQWSW